MAADIFGQRVKGDIGPVLDRPLKDRTEQRVVAGDDRRVSLLPADRIGHTADHGDIDEAVGGVGRRFHKNDRDAAFGHGLLGSCHYRAFVDAICETDCGYSEIEECLGDQRFRAAIEWLRMQDRVARSCKGEKGCRDGRHAGGKQRAAFCLFIDGETILDDFAIRVVEARIDEPDASACWRFGAAGDVIEEIATVFGRFEDEGGSQENGRLDCALGELGVVAVIQHLGFGMEGVVADMRFGRMRRSHDGLLSRRHEF